MVDPDLQLAGVIAVRTAVVGSSRERKGSQIMNDKVSEVMAAFDNRNTHDTESLKRLGGEFYRIGDEEWCDTSIASWRKEGPDTWVRRG